MDSNRWPRKTGATLGFQHVLAPEPDTGERWSVIWDITRKSETEGRNTALEKVEAAALDRAKHMLSLGFVVYEIRAPSGSVFLEEAGIKQRLGLAPEPAAA